jgi:chemotaxis family two-component system response regulator Rcp1
MYDAVVAPYDRRGKKMPIDILLVEDNEGDIRLIREILGAVNPTACLHVVTDGAEAMNFLRYQGPYADAPRPNVIVMDLNLPKVHGHEVLALLKTTPQFQTIPVIVLTSSQAESHVESCYQLMANSYLQKPDNLQEYEALVKLLNQFWFTRVKLPNNTRRRNLSL